MQIMLFLECGFQSSRQLVCEAVDDSVSSQNLTSIKKTFSTSTGSENNKMSSVDQSFEDELLQFVPKGAWAECSSPFSRPLNP